MAGEPLIVLSGPTGSGKTAVAIALARRFPVEIVGADSMQVYRGMDIGTAKPTPEERAGIPHHLVDVADPDEEFSAGRYVALARAAIAAIGRRGRVPLVVGGTGMYIRSLLRGLDALPAEPEVRARLARRWAAEGAEALYGELRRLDPATAESVCPADRLRVVRALEIAEITGGRPSALRRSWGNPSRRTCGAGAPPARTLFLALDPGREEVRRRVDFRVDAMLRKGFSGEVRRLLEAGYGPELKSMKAIGYRHLVSHLRGGVPLPEAVAAMKRDTRRYAKRQMTWLKREPEVRWIGGESQVEPVSGLVRNLLF